MFFAGAKRMPNGRQRTGSLTPTRRFFQQLLKQLLRRAPFVNPRQKNGH
jgi:hypothetical protein